MKDFDGYSEPVQPRVLHLSTTGRGGGGAGRAAIELHRAMIKEGVSSDFVSAQGIRSSWSRWADRQTWKLQRSPVKTWRSPAVFGSLSARFINEHPSDVVNLHWVTDGFLSIETIGRIEKPIVWSLYDMWPFCGTEHYGIDASEPRWRVGYTPLNRPAKEHGLDLDRYVWDRKREHWHRSHVIAASSWLQSRVEESALMGTWPITKIPHVIDTAVFTSTDQETARKHLRIPQSEPVILFLSSAGIGDARKGFDYLETALPAVKSAIADVRLLVVGPPTSSITHAGGVPIHWFGTTARNEVLRDLYSAADITVVPSREDNLPLTAMEAQSCARPVVAFRIGGLPDIVDHNKTGYLAKEGDAQDLAQGLTRALISKDRSRHWGDAARKRAIADWSASPVVAQYLDVYQAALN